MAKTLFYGGHIITENDQDEIYQKGWVWWKMIASSVSEKAIPRKWTARLNVGMFRDML